MNNTVTQQKVSEQYPYDIVCQLHSDGRHLIPTDGGDAGKKPLIPPWVKYQKRQPTGAGLHGWKEKYHPAVGTVVCGAKSSVIVIDADNQTRLKEIEAYGLKPHILTPKGGHFYVKHPEYPVKPLINVISGIDIRGGGSYARRGLLITKEQGPYHTWEVDRS